MGEVLRAHGEQGGPQYHPDLYGAYLFRDGRHDPEVLRQYVVDQELTHIAEGLALRQNHTYTMELQLDGSLVDSRGEDTEVMAIKGYKETQQKLEHDEAYEPLARRQRHDIQIARRTRTLMQEGADGDAFLVMSPYGEEIDNGSPVAADNPVQRVLGHWPSRRRSFMWLYRKAGDTTLETTVITIDQSRVTTYRELLAQFGIETPDGIESHDIPAVIATLPHIPDVATRRACTLALREEYYRLQGDAAADDAINEEQEALDFLRANAYHFVSHLADVQEAAGRSLESNRLDPLIRASADLAISTLDRHCLTQNEKQSIQRLLDGSLPENDREQAMGLIVRAQRFGIWKALSDELRGEKKPAATYIAGSMGAVYDQLGVNTRQLRMIQGLYGKTNQAASQRQVMPGCGGSTSFLQSDEGDVKESIFSSDTDSASERKNWKKRIDTCVVMKCPTRPDKVEVGPCGVCLERCQMLADEKGDDALL